MHRLSDVWKKYIIISGFLLSSCDDPSGPEKNTPMDPGTIIANDMSNSKIYRFLSAVKADSSEQRYYQGRPVGLSDFSRQMITAACVQELSFKTVLPSAEISSAREFEIPVEAIVNDEVTDVVKYREEVIPPRNVDGVIFESEKKIVPYTVKGPSIIPVSVRGVCIGTEYILK